MAIVFSHIVTNLVDFTSPYKYFHTLLPSVIKQTSNCPHVLASSSLLSLSISRDCLMSVFSSLPTFSLSPKTHMRAITSNRLAEWGQLPAMINWSCLLMISALGFERYKSLLFMGGSWLNTTTAAYCGHPACLQNGSH